MIDDETIRELINHTGKLTEKQIAGASKQLREEAEAAAQHHAPTDAAQYSSDYLNVRNGTFRERFVSLGLFVVFAGSIIALRVWFHNSSTPTLAEPRRVWVIGGTYHTWSDCPEIKLGDTCRITTEAVAEEQGLIHCPTCSDYDDFMSDVPERR